MLDRQRLGAILGMLGSDHDGEVLAAARHAERIRRSFGVEWLDLLADTSPPDGRRTAQGDADPLRRPDWRSTVADLLARPEALTAWERSFLAELANYRQNPSARQAAILEALAAKIRK